MNQINLPPLVEAADVSAPDALRNPMGSTAAPIDFDRHMRQMILPDMGIAGQSRLAAARVAVIGAGGLGSPIITYLAGAGVGHLRIIDDDVIDRSNLHRQVIHEDAHVGWPKAESAAAVVRALDPTIAVIPLPIRLTEENAATLLADVDLVVDGTDDFDTRYLVSDTCAALGIPLVWGAVLGFDAQVSVFWSRPPEGSGVAPVTLRDVFPEPPAPGLVPNCAVAGVIGALCGQAGSLMAMEAIKLICGLGSPLIGTIAVIDALAGTQAQVPFTPAPSAAPAPDRAPDAVHSSWEPPKLPTRIAQAEIGVDELRAALDSTNPPRLVDVRPAADHARGHIPGDQSIPLEELPGRIAELADDDRPLVLYCQAQVRSNLALELVAPAIPGVKVLRGGFVDWAAADAPSVSD